MPTRPSLPQRSLLIGVLTVGALLFALPYINMVTTSVKMDEEMGVEHFSLIPKTPIPRSQSPYVQLDTGHEIKRPVGLDRATWEAFETPFRSQIHKTVDDWWQKQSILLSAFPNFDRAAEIDSLTNVVGSVVLARISDEARKKGAPAMLREVTGRKPKRLWWWLWLKKDQGIAPLVSPDKIKDAFDEFMPRLCLGDVTVRLTDYSKHLAGTGEDWSASTANCSTTPLAPPAVKEGQTASLLTYNSPDHSPISATMTPIYASPPALNLNPNPNPNPAPTTAPTTHPALLLPPLTSAQAPLIDRVYVYYRADQSWGKINLLVTLNGRQYRLDESLYLAWTRWQVLEVRIPGHEEVPVSGRNFFLLKDIGPAPANAPPFSVAFTIEPASQLSAWWAKISRNYYTAFRQVPILRYIATSISLAILSIILTTFGSSLSAYAFARLDFPGRNVFFGILLATMMIPGQVTMIPGFLIHKSLGWYNTLYPLWVGAVFGSAFYIFMMRQFFLAIPKELEDAARIDGCGFFGIYWHIMLPLVRPTLVTIAIFSFIGSWNNFMGPLIYLNDERLYNLAFGLYKFNLVSGANNSLIMSGSFIMTLPIIALFFFFQRYFIRGIAISGLGGR